MITKLLNQILSHTPNPQLIERTFLFAKKAHEGQKRVSGEDYLIHPVVVANTLFRWGLDTDTVAAAFLHDVLDDTPYTLQDIEKEFGETIAFLVEGVSKLGKLRIPKERVKIRSAEERKEGSMDFDIENLRKMFFAMAQDLRVVFIKLADRFHNMQTLGALPPDRRKRIALETMEIFAPIANRLGMGEVKGQLEDLAFPHLYPKEFAWLRENVQSKYEERIRYISKIMPIIKTILVQEGISPQDIHARAKHYWSLYQKLLRHDMNLEQIHDLVALRIIIDSTENCYRALGILHKHFKPLPGLIKDYIAFPKPNNYRSLHTTCFCVEGKITEIQIKTAEMHQEAEYGIAAHWAYKEGIVLRGIQRKKFSWVQQLIEWQKERKSSKEFLEGLKIDFFKHRIFVFSPKGDIIDLPEGATPIDFAYSIHSEIGNHCAAAKVNGKLVALNSHLASGDVVEILTDKKKKPSRDWLEFVKTTVAKTRIRDFLKKESREENLGRGLSLINQALKVLGKSDFAHLPNQKIQKLLKTLVVPDSESLLVAIGEGGISPREVVKILFQEEEIFTPNPSRIHLKPPAEAKNLHGIALAGTIGLSLRLAKCCMPKPPQNIFGYITQNKGASIHSENCENLLAIKQKWPSKIVEASWIAESLPYIASIVCLVNDRVGLLRDLSSAISASGINILRCTTTSSKEQEQRIKFQLELKRLEELTLLLQRLKHIEGVKEVKKI